MACGVPCAVTDVGDSAYIVGPEGRVVPPGRPEELAAAVVALVEAGRERRQALGASARARIERLFSLPAVVDRYLSLYREVLQGA